MRETYEVYNVVFYADKSPENRKKYNLVTLEVKGDIKMPISLSRYSKLFIESPFFDPVKEAYDKKDEEYETSVDSSDDSGDDGYDEIVAAVIKEPVSLSKKKFLSNKKDISALLITDFVMP